MTNTVIFVFIGLLVISLIISLFYPILKYVLLFIVRGTIGILCFVAINSFFPTVAFGINYFIFTFIGLLGIWGFISITITQIFMN